MKQRTMPSPDGPRRADARGRTAPAPIWLLLWLSAASCAYHPYVGPLQPLDQQAPGMTVYDDGSVLYQRERFEVRVKPMTDAELNRLYADASAGGRKATNAYTYGDLTFGGADSTRSRFTVFHVAVKNYSFPKVRVDPARAVIEADNGRQYYSLSLQQLENYYRAYALGYRGNEYARLRERLDLLRRTLLSDAIVFSGREAEGFLVFPVLHTDVHAVRVLLPDVVLRFDYREEPVETTQVICSFHRLTGKLYPDGRRVVTYAPSDP